ncbi:tRNA (adenosine(37)-N6)-threonylcarbamoyltransferase complex ATPase subunit type 1 TsaE [Candidatus Campbellbacteria bacterium CG22_combo_CG10-13_8_21_14_all_36_13]|uniref:tRNA threonylcarbamoyladenosine biosynthesis protein TsaE n=1 Tax=Candidatus Campbellbacteria bacterium CG22_combo_CG10-13_8_21_14_all_36_13 TaxID=1974529 RepID=A0A2H0DXS2_9BACT|nr:MAG: tRNA (adenosine(37)-N6)-threonylcarbamoyltransferase complex ATPase subunit type 1 TsaE [Candidatus Campbellbacteria bacterium CG22_combo_CG10-13_8_21_14_all_36_13]
MKKIVSREELGRFVRDFLEKIEPHSNKATTIVLFGNLGAGKTTFTQESAKYFGIKEVVTSPTFVVEKIYKLNNQKFSQLIHIDAYRLTKGSELKALGWKELIENPSNVIFIEWPENVEEVVPKDSIQITFDVVDEKSRSIEIINNI